MSNNIIKTCALFQIKDNYELSFEYSNRRKFLKAICRIDYEFINYIKKELALKDIKCGRTKIEGNICYGSNFSFLDHSVGFVWYTISFLSSLDNIYAAVECWNYFSCWKRLFYKYSDKEYRSGEALEKLVPIVNTIITSNPKIYNVKWMTHKELYDFFFERQMQLSGKTPEMLLK